MDDCLPNSKVNHIWHPGAVEASNNNLKLTLAEVAPPLLVDSGTFANGSLKPSNLQKKKLFDLNIC